MAPTISVRNFKIHLQRHQLLNREIDESYIQNELGIVPEQLDDDDGRIPLNCVYQLIQHTAEKENDPILGLRYSKGQFMSFVKSVNSIKQHATSLPDYISLLSRYLCLSTEIGSISSHHNNHENELIVRFNPVDPDHITYHQVDGALVMLMESIQSNFALTPTLVTFRHGIDETLRHHYDSSFLCELSFQQPENELHYQSDKIVLPNSLEHEDFSQSLESIAPIERAKHLHHQAQDNAIPLSDSVTFLLERLLNRGEPSREAVAKLLCISVRTLQRKLSQEGTTYQDLMDTTRKKMALQYLELPSATHTDIAFWLGYSEPSQYYKAFKRWFSMAAKDYAR